MKDQKVQFFLKETEKDIVSNELTFLMETGRFRRYQLVERKSVESNSEVDQSFRIKLTWW